MGHRLALSGTSFLHLAEDFFIDQDMADVVRCFAGAVALYANVASLASALTSTAGFFPAVIQRMTK
jgi:hypothetical protein